MGKINRIRLPGAAADSSCCETRTGEAGGGGCETCPLLLDFYFFIFCDILGVPQAPDFYYVVSKNR